MQARTEELPDGRIVTATVAWNEEFVRALNASKSSSWEIETETCARKGRLTHHLPSLFYFRRVVGLALWGHHDQVQAFCVRHLWFGVKIVLWWRPDGQHKARYLTACWLTFEEAVEGSSLSLVSNPWVLGRKRHGMSVSGGLGCLTVNVRAAVPTALTEPSNVVALTRLFPPFMAGVTGMIPDVIPGFHVLKLEN